MLTYKYEARNTQTGETIKAEVQADNEQSANKLITAQGYTPISLVLSKSNGASRFGRIKSKDRVLFSRQLSTLINAGLPLVQSLRSVASQTTNKPLKVIINNVISDVEAGTAFNVALAKHPKVFNKVYIALIAASEVSGTLDSGLERLADQQEKDAEIIAKVRGAMTYPIIVLMVMMGVAGFMIVKVLPQVQNIYSGIKGAKLPFITQFLLAISHFITHFWWIVIILVALAIVGSLKWAQTILGRSVFDTLKMKAWPVGPLFMKMYMARFARTGTTLVASGVPLLQMLEITADAVNNVHIHASLHKAIEKVKGGKSIADALTNDPNFLELVPNMLRIGEQSGALEAMLEKVADYYEKEVDNQIKAISTIIEPVLMVVMGVIALTIVGAILLPIYGLVNQAGFGG
ncbi:MAG: putative Type pilus assembly protein PilC [Candidatus Saccharibacteria bacterium]|nr:putative Type pilus assembly protein PilC [Candidatus Saccharibacteria bacterium]